MTAPKFTPSAHQQKFFDWIKTGNGSAVMIAVAGSGKSTTIRNALPLIPESKFVHIFAFNTTIAREMQDGIARVAKETGRSVQRVRASTFHSVGFGAIAKFLGKPANMIQTDGSKCRKLFKDMVGESDFEDYGAFVARLVGLAKGEGIGALVPDTEERWFDLVRHHDLTLETETATETRGIEYARLLLKRSNEVAKADAYIDFDDQLYLPLLWKLRLWQNDFVFIDEAQDTNPVRRAIAKLALRPGGRLVAVGDPRQAIYGFTGASHDAIELIKREFHAVELPLTVSYRCPRAVGEMAKTLVPYFEVNQGAPEGSVDTLDLADGLRSFTAADAILCRNTNPLVELAYYLIGQGKGCTILGRDIGEGLINLVKKMRAQSIDRLVVKLEEYRAREEAKHMAKGEEQKAESVNDRVACVLTVIDNLPETQRTIGALVTRLGNLFEEKSGVLTLCTAHKAKGKEWDRVGILRPDLMPSKWARQDWQVQQEENLMYVSWTRAKRDLVFLEGKVKDIKRKEAA